MFDIITFLQDHDCHPIDCNVYVQSECPIHGGNNRTGFCYYKESGIWNCWTKGCGNDGKRNVNSLLKLIYNGNKLKISEALQKYGCNNTVPNSPSPNDVEEKLKPKEIDLYWCPEVEKLGYTVDFCKKYEVGGVKSKKGNVYGIAYRVFDKDNNYLGHTTRLLDEFREVLYKKNGQMPAKWKHSKGLRTGRILYGEQYLDSKNETVILVESPKDTLFLIKNGFKNVVGTFGVGLRRKQEDTLINFGFRNLYYFLDNDNAGNAHYSTRNFKRTCSLFNVKIVTDKLPTGCDPDDLNKDELDKILCSDM